MLASVNPMKKYWIHRLLIVLMVLTQPVIAMTDSHQFLQSDRQHIEPSHEHKKVNFSVISVTDQIKDEATEQSAGLFDCQYCCHCHSVYVQYLSISQLVTDFVSMEQILTDYSRSLTNSPNKALFRPPKA